MIVSSLGFPRIGPRRELKEALEAYWAGTLDERALLERAEGLRAATWARQHAAGVTHIPSNDFSLYDHVLDTTVLVDAVPERYRSSTGAIDLATYFALARGTATERALELTKWFDTNYHYLVPELAPGQQFSLGSTKPVDEFLEARSLGFETRPVILGPVTFLLLAKTIDGSDPLALLPRLLPVYKELLDRLAAAGATWVQIDEPAFVRDLDENAQAALETAYAELSTAAGIRLLLTTYLESSATTSTSRSRSRSPGCTSTSSVAEPSFHGCSLKPRRGSSCRSVSLTDAISGRPTSPASST